MPMQPYKTHKSETFIFYVAVHKYSEKKAKNEREKIILLSHRPNLEYLSKQGKKQAKVVLKRLSRREIAKWTEGRNDDAAKQIKNSSEFKLALDSVTNNVTVTIPRLKDELKPQKVDSNGNDSPKSDVVLNENKGNINIETEESDEEITIKIQQQPTIKLTPVVTNGHPTSENSKRARSSSPMSSESSLSSGTTESKKTSRNNSVSPEPRNRKRRLSVPISPINKKLSKIGSSLINQKLNTTKELKHLLGNNSPKAAKNGKTEEGRVTTRRKAAPASVQKSREL
jgi:hypothetical protein